MAGTVCAWVDVNTEFIKNPSRTEQIKDGRDGLVILGCHQAMAVNLTSNLPIPLGKSACKFDGISTARCVYNLLVLNSSKIWENHFRISDLNHLMQ